MKNVLRSLIGLSLVWSVAAHALVIYENNANVNITVFSDPNRPQFIADDFTLRPGLNRITGVRWTGVYASNSPTGPDNFRIELFADVARAPALTPITSLFIGDPGRTDTGVDIFSNDLFVYSVTVPPIILAPDTTFWLSIVNDTSADLISDWAWGSQLFDFGPGTIAARTSEADPWFLSSAFAQDFTISGPVSIPEPGTIVLLGMGLFGLLRYRRLRES
jgi:PEP-CTERM motif